MREIDTTLGGKGMGKAGWAMLLSSTAGSSLGSNKSAIVGHLNGMTKKACATFILSLPTIAFQLRVPVDPLFVSKVKIKKTFVSLRE